MNEVAVSEYALRHDEFKVIQDSQGKERFADPALEILRRSLNSPTTDDIAGLFTEGSKHLLTNLPVSAFSDRGLMLLGFKTENPQTTLELIDSFVDRSKQALEQAINGGNSDRIAQEERRVAHEIREIVSGIPYEKSVDFPVAITDRRALNCVGAQRLGGLIMDRVGLTYLMAETPGHSLHMLVSTADNKIVLEDMLSPDMEVEMTNEKMKGAQVLDLTELTVSEFNNGVVTFELNTPELDGMRDQLIKRKGKQFTCRVYSSEIGYALQLLGNLSSKFHKPEWVMTFSKVGLQLSSKYAPLIVRFGKAKEILNGIDEAQKHYQDALVFEPGIAANHARLGRVYAEKGELQKSLTCYKNALKITPNDGHMISRIADLYAKMGDVEKAKKTYRQSIKVDERYAWPQIQLMKILLEEGRVKDATKIAKKCLSVDYYSAGAVENVAEFFEKHIPEFAEEMYQKAMEKGSDQLFLKVNYAKYLTKLERIDEAKVVYEALLKEHENDPWAYRIVGDFLLNTGQTHEALDIFSRVASLQYKGHQQVIEDQMIGYFQDMDEFPEIYKTVVWTTDSWAYQHIAEKLEKLGKTQEAIKVMHIAVDVDPYSVYNHRLLGNMYRTLNYIEMAVVEFKEVLKLSPSDYSVASDLVTLLVECSASDEEILHVLQPIAEQEWGNLWYSDVVHILKLAEVSGTVLHNVEIRQKITSQLVERCENTTELKQLAEFGVAHNDLDLAERSYKKLLQWNHEFRNIYEYAKILLDLNKPDVVSELINSRVILGGSDLEGLTEYRLSMLIDLCRDRIEKAVYDDLKKYIASMHNIGKTPGQINNLPTQSITADHISNESANPLTNENVVVFMRLIEVGKESGLSISEQNQLRLNMEALLTQKRDIVNSIRDIEKHNPGFAKQMYKTIIKTNPNAYACYRLAMLQPEEKRMSLLKKGLALEPHILLLEEIKRLSVKNEKYDTAFDAERLIYIHHPHMANFSELENYAVLSGNIRKASKIASALILGDERISSTLIEKIANFYKNHEMEVAFLPLTEEPVVQTYTLNAMVNLGEFYGIMGRKDLEQACFLHVLEESGDPKIFFRLLQNMKFPEQNNLADKHLDRVIKNLTEHDGREIDAYLSVLAQIHNSALAKKIISEVVSEKPTADRFVTLARYEKPKEAIELYRKALVMENSATLHNGLGMMLYTSGDLKGAIDEYIVSYKLSGDENAFANLVSLLHDDSLTREEISIVIEDLMKSEMPVRQMEYNYLQLLEICAERKMINFVDKIEKYFTQKQYLASDIEFRLWNSIANMHRSLGSNSIAQDYEERAKRASSLNVLFIGAARHIQR